ncbi:MAG: RICIN domain-containing protein [Halieaceae bacterium]|jgi:hypothetical protein|nr:RICIN domain-containing protein [Halieaceae bacterium]
MKALPHLFAGLLAASLAAGAAAQFNTDALKKMQEEGHKIVEEQQAAEAASAAENAKALAEKKAVEDTKATAVTLQRRAYRHGGTLCLDARGALSVETCNPRAPSQQWALDANNRLVAHDGRCLAGASLVKCAGGNTQQWVHDKRGRLRNQAQQCLQVRSAKAGARVDSPACSGAPTQVWSN